MEPLKTYTKTMRYWNRVCTSIVHVHVLEWRVDTWMPFIRHDIKYRCNGLRGRCRPRVLQPYILAQMTRIKYTYFIIICRINSIYILRQNGAAVNRYLLDRRRFICLIDALDLETMNAKSVRGPCTCNTQTHRETNEVRLITTKMWQTMHAGNISQVPSTRADGLFSIDWAGENLWRFLSFSSTVEKWGEKLTTKWAKLILFMGDASVWLKYVVSWPARTHTHTLTLAMIPDGHTVHFSAAHPFDCVISRCTPPRAQTRR